MKINFVGEDSDDDPTHVTQILSKESVDTLLETIKRLQQYSSAASSSNSSQNGNGDTDLNMLFSVKVSRLIYFPSIFVTLLLPCIL
jgi:hypothetical protein